MNILFAFFSADISYFYYYFIFAQSFSRHSCHQYIKFILTMNGKRKDMPIWLLENLEKNTFQGLKWEEKEKLTFKIVWERNQTHNSELTMEICKVN